MADSVRCKLCRINFSKTSNLRAHVKRKHPEKLDILAPKKQFKHKVTCKECNTKFVNIGNFRTHVRQQHPGKLEELAPIQKCKKAIVQKTVVKQVKCPLCQLTYPSTTIISHYRETHSLQIDFETLEFKSFEAFEEWKSQIETDTSSSFANMHGYRKNKNVIKIKYTCHRSGNVRKKGKDIRKPKAQGTIKINAYCPASMNLEIHHDKCLVEYCRSHVGHKQEFFWSALKRQANKISDDAGDSISYCRSLDWRNVVKIDMGWMVPCTSIKDFFVVKQLQSECSCTLMCNDCLTCLHRFTCSCLDSSQKWNMCKHIHMVGQFLKRNHDSSSSPEDDLSDNRIDESTNLVTDSVDRSTSYQHKSLEKKQRLIRSFQQEVLNAESMEELEVIEQMIAPIKPRLEAFRNNRIERRTKRTCSLSSSDDDERYIAFS